MKKILLANIGNRSLVIKREGETATFIGNDSSSFRDTTESIKQFMLTDNANSLQNVVLKNEPPFTVELNILNTLLAHRDRKKEEDFTDITEIHIFVTDQSNDNDGIRDTIHAGDIVKKLIETPTRAVNIHTIKGSYTNPCLTIKPVNTEQLIPWYRKKFEELQKQYQNEKAYFVLCDSGGTPQQKAAMKIVAEYFLPEEQYEFVNIIEKLDKVTGNPSIGKSTLISQKGHTEYKTIIAAQQIELLINQGQYYAAATIAGSTSLPILQALMLNHHRFNLLEFKKEGAQIPLPFVAHYFEPTPDTPLMWKQYLTAVDYKKLRELLAITDFYYGIENWTEVVLNAQIFIETLINSMIMKHISPNVVLEYYDFNNTFKNSLNHLSLQDREQIEKNYLNHGLNIFLNPNNRNADAKPKRNGTHTNYKTIGNGEHSSSIPSKLGYINFLIIQNNPSFNLFFYTN